MLAAQSINFFERLLGKGSRDSVFAWKKVSLSGHDSWGWGGRQNSCNPDQERLIGLWGCLSSMGQPQGKGQQNSRKCVTGRETASAGSMSEAARAGGWGQHGGQR